MKPNQIKIAVREIAEEYHNPAIAQLNLEDIRRVRGEMRRAMQRSSWIREALGVDDDR